SILKHESDVEVVVEALNGAEAERMAGALSPDVILMDTRMPVMDGLHATRHILSHPRPPVVIVLTTFDCDEFVYRSLRHGAAGFLLKDTSPEELVAAVRTAMTGDQILSPRITRRLIASFVATPHPGEAATS